MEKKTVKKIELKEEELSKVVGGSTVKGIFGAAFQNGGRLFKWWWK